MHKNIGRKFAFTLAEVLITLGIIGVVAALTIPVLMKKYTDTEQKSRFKKAYATIVQAGEQVKMDNGGSFAEICPYFNNFCLTPKFTPYLKAAKVCTNAATQGCWHAWGNWYNSKIQGSGICNQGSDCGITGYDSFNHLEGVILADGTPVVFAMQDNTCLTPPFFGATIYIDTNGFKPPNQLGEDIAALQMYKYKIAPWYGAGQGPPDFLGHDSSWKYYGLASKYLMDSIY